jgi:hypothetical protein
LKTKPDEEALASAILSVTKNQKPETLDQLVQKVYQETPSFSKEEILDKIMTLKSEGKISLTAQLQTATRFSVYARGGSALWFWITTALAISTIIFVFTIPEDSGLILARQIFGAIFILWLPGYTFIKALFPQSRRRKKDLDPIERISLSVGMSLALVPITGLLLNYTPWGIRLTPITLSLLVLTMAFATTALIREYKIQTQKAEP